MNSTFLENSFSDDDSAVFGLSNLIRDPEYYFGSVSSINSLPYCHNNNAEDSDESASMTFIGDSTVDPHIFQDPRSRFWENRLIIKDPQAFCVAQALYKLRMEGKKLKKMQRKIEKAMAFEKRNILWTKEESEENFERNLLRFALDVEASLDEANRAGRTTYNRVALRLINALFTKSSQQITARKLFKRVVNFFFPPTPSA